MPNFPQFPMNVPIPTPSPLGNQSPPSPFGFGALVPPKMPLNAPAGMDPKMSLLLMAAGNSLMSNDPGTFGKTLLAGSTQLRDLEEQKKKRIAISKFLKDRGRGDLVTMVDNGAADVAMSVYKADEARKAAAKNSLSYSKTPTYFETPDGEVKIGTIGDDGSFKEIDLGSGNKVADLSVKVDAGTYWSIRDRRTNAEIGRVPKNVGEEAFATEIGKGEAKKTIEFPEKQRAAKALLSSLDSQHKTVIDEIRRAKQYVSGWTTGVGSTLKDLPFGPARQLAELLTTIRSNIGFDKLQAMREASPTGGALGQVSNFEVEQLQSVFGSLSQAQTDENLNYNLDRLLEILEGGQRNRQQAYKEDFGEDAPSAPSAAPTSTTRAPLPDKELLRKYGITN